MKIMRLNWNINESQIVGKVPMLIPDHWETNVQIQAGFGTNCRVWYKFYLNIGLGSNYQKISIHSHASESNGISSKQS
jgi:hypothetical protein